jgi:RNA polymerase sigma-70 factor, ECF subfamily
MISFMSRTRGADTGPDQALGEEAELLRRCRAGERAAQEDFYRRYRRGVAANLYRVLHDRTDLDDLVQEVFVIAFRGLDRFRGEARLSTWLYRICVNIALGRIRARSRRPPPIPMADPELDRDLTATPPETPEKLLQRRQAHERVYRALDGLAPKKRMVLYLHEIQGHSLSEIAYLMKANPVTVRTRLFYARKEFYKRLVQDAAGDAMIDAAGEAPSEPAIDTAGDTASDGEPAGGHAGHARGATGGKPRGSKGGGA